MRLITITITTIFSLFIGSVPAADKQGNYAIWGMGNQSCHTYNEARAEKKDDPFRYYVMGYLTAYNVHEDDTYSISGEQKMPDIMVWFDEFCDAHAVYSFEGALKEFILENYEERMQSIPKPFRR